MSIKCGFLPGCLGNKELADVAAWASSVGFETFELPAAPGSIMTNVDIVLTGGAGEIRSACADNNIEISSLTYCANHLDPRERDANNAHMRKVIEAASQLETGIIGCFVGGTGGDFYGEMALFEEYFMPLVDYAGQHDVKLAIENCPAGGKNIGRSPYFWREMFEASDNSDYLGLEFDPSHLVWLQVDWKKALQEFATKKKIFILHGKDTLIDEAVLADRGFYEGGWWKYKIPGLGVIDWKFLFDTLKKSGFSGAINIEHEDSEYSGGEEKVKEGLLIGLDSFRNAI
jgi:sugar phosphate isomerase/epimerase